MNEEIEQIKGSGSESGAAVWAALAAADRQKADRFLDEQTEFVRLQREHLHEQQDLVLSHLRWQRFDDQLMGALKIILLVIGAGVLTAIVAAVWNASQADGLVIDQFSVPPSLAGTGMTSEVLTEDFRSKLSSIGEFTNENSFSRSKEVTADRKEAVRIEIPQTGISLAEAWRFLRDWLGHERHISGTLRQDSAGRITLTTNVSGATSTTVSGADLRVLEQDAAEKTFGVLDPVNIVNYYTGRGRLPEAMAAAAHFASIAATPIEKSDAYALWCYTTGFATGNVPLAVARCRIAVELDPRLAVAHFQLARFLFVGGQDGKALEQLKIIPTLNDADQMPAHRGVGFETMRVRALARVAALTGDFAGSDLCGGHSCSEAEKLLSQAENAARLHDAATAASIEDKAAAAGTVDKSATAIVAFYIHSDRGEWREAAAAARIAKEEYPGENVGFSARYFVPYAATQFDPLLAQANAMLGDFREAQQVIDETPADCYACMRARGLIAERENRPASAVYWYARAASAAPSIPFAFADWGELLLRAGKYDAAISKFKEAHEKGPHFADPLELWGEALMQKNRSDLALVKFEEANKYAPNWGRLHLEWGKALVYAGKEDEARRQFAVAASLGLTPHESLELSQAERGAHG